jgi:hypothetical protein
MILTASFALSGWGGAAQGGLLFSDGDFDAQFIDQPVGAPWGPVGAGHTVTSAAQSPYDNVYPDNGKGVHIPASSGNPYLVRMFPENAIPAGSTGTFYFNVDFRNNSVETGDYSIVITRDANGGLRSVALYVTGDTLYADSGTGIEPVLALQQGTWYNLRLTLDLATKTYAGVVSTFAESTVIPSRPFVRSDVDINSVYTDGGTSYAAGTASDHDLDNWALSNTPLPPPSGGAFVKSTAPHGEGFNKDVAIAIELEDAGTAVDRTSIQLFVNGQTVLPTITKPDGSVVTTVTYTPDGGWQPSAYAVKLTFADTGAPPTSQTNEFSFEVVDPLVAGSVVNVDFNGLREGDVLGPTFEGVGAGGGGRIFNGIVANSIQPGGGNNDNLTVGAVNLVNSFGDVTTVGFTVAPMGGDVGGSPTTDPLSSAALFSDYIFNNSAGNTAGESPFQISGLGSVPFVDLYFYQTFQTGWRVTIPGAGATTFSGQGIFAPDNTFYFHRVPVNNGVVDGTFGSGTAVVCGMSIVSPLPRPFVKSASPTGPGVRPEASITVELEDYVTEVVTNSIRLLVNGQRVAPVISKPQGTPITTVTYAPPSGFAQGSSNTFTIIFGDSAIPSVVQSNEFTFVVLSEASAVVTINIDFNGARNVPGPRGPGPTYVGQGAAGGGIVWNGLLADSRLPDGGDDDNITVSGDNLLNSIGGATPITFIISPVGGDDAGAPAGTDPASASALFGDYVFVGAAGQLSGMADFTIGGLETAPYVDLYFYFGASGNFTIPDASPSSFAARGIFTPANTVAFRKVPVTDGAVAGVLGTGPVSLLYGLTIQKPLPQPFVESYSPDVAPGTKLRTNEVGIIQIVLRDYVSQVVTSSIQLSLNAQLVPAQINQEPGAGVTTVTYDPSGALLLDATNIVRLVFSDDANPVVVQSLEFEIAVMSEAAAGRIINIDFDGNRNVPGPNSLPLTYVGQGAAAGGTVFNSLPADSRLPDGITDNDNLTVGGTDLLSSIGTATPVSFTVSPVGGDSTAGRTGGNTDDPANPAALFSDYVFNNSAGNHAGQSPFTIGGLGSTPAVDLYFYKGPGSVFIAGAQPASFAGIGIFTSANTVYFAGVPVTDGQVAGSFGGGTTVIYGMTIVLLRPPLRIVLEGNDVIISWSGPGTLQATDELPGGWQDVPNATNPLTLVSPQGHRFYRLRP